MMRKCIFIVASLFLVSCGSKPQKTVNEDADTNVAKNEMRQAAEGLPVIDLQKEYPLKQMVLQDVAEKDINKKTFSMPDPFSLLYDKHTGECVRVDFSDAGGISAEIALKKLKNRMSGNLHTLPDNCLLQNYPAHFLMELNEKGALKGELKEIASKLNEDDNPVLMLAKFSE